MSRHQRDISQGRGASTRLVRVWQSSLPTPCHNRAVHCSRHWPIPRRQLSPEQISLRKSPFLLVKHLHSSIPPCTEGYQTLLPCALCTYDLFLTYIFIYVYIYNKYIFFIHIETLYLVSCLCKPALLPAAVPTDRLCPGLSLFPASVCPPDHSLPFHLVRILQEAFPQGCCFCPLGMFLWFPCWSVAISPCCPTQPCSPAHSCALWPIPAGLSIFKEPYSGYLFLPFKFQSPLQPKWRLPLFSRRVC